MPVEYYKRNKMKLKKEKKTQFQAAEQHMYAMIHFEQLEMRRNLSRMAWGVPF